MIDDQQSLAASTAEYLTWSGVPSSYVTSAEAALAQIESSRPKILLLDVNLPGLDGFDFCRKVRERYDMPIVFVSARVAEEDQIRAFLSGGDDYLTKPYSLALLLAKIRRMLARMANDVPPAPEPYDDGWLFFEPSSGRVRVDGSDIQLAALELRLLEYLIANRGRVVERKELFEQVWGGSVTADGTLSVHIRRLRLHIEHDADRPRYIRTAWGRGYIFEEPR